MKTSLLRTLAAITLIALSATSAQSSAVLDAYASRCNAVKQASASGKSASVGRYNSVGSSAMSSIASQRSCMQAFGSSGAASIISIGGMDFGSMIMESACKVVAKEVSNATNSASNAVSNLTGGIIPGSSPIILTPYDPGKQTARDPSGATIVPNDAKEFMAMMNNPANAGLQIPWPKDLSGFDQDTQNLIKQVTPDQPAGTYWQRGSDGNSYQWVTGPDGKSTVADTPSAVWGLTPGVTGSIVGKKVDSFWDTVSCKVMGGC